MHMRWSLLIVSALSVVFSDPAQAEVCPVNILFPADSNCVCPRGYQRLLDVCTEGGINYPGCKTACDPIPDYNRKCPAGYFMGPGATCYQNEVMDEIRKSRRKVYRGEK